jgi:hypothetical protein
MPGYSPKVTAQNVQEKLPMATYLQHFDATPQARRWPLVRGWIFNEPLPFCAELRRDRPILTMPEVTPAARFDDCMQIFNRFDLFSVALYKPKQGSYWMAQDDTAVHWREKSVMRAILDFEEVPAIRTWVATKTAAVLAAANGSIDFAQGLAIRTARRPEGRGADRHNDAKVGAGLEAGCATRRARRAGSPRRLWPRLPGLFRPRWNCADCPFVVRGQANPGGPLAYRRGGAFNRPARRRSSTVWALTR